MKYIDELCTRRKNLEPIKYDIVKAFETLRDCYRSGNKLLICGNGGSAADCSHITGELMKGFKKKRTIDEKTEKNLSSAIENFYDKNNNFDVINKLNDMKKNLEQGLPTIDLTSLVGLNTAFANDKSAEYVYANGVLGLGKQNDVLLAISTSGNSKNVVNAALVAKAKGVKVIALSGKGGGLLKDIADINIIIPLDETFLIQEEHIAIYHAICLDIEDEFYEQ
jgi:D-sedoheptulose 7-phosphate isomerase